MKVPTRAARAQPAHSTRRPAKASQTKPNQPHHTTPRGWSCVPVHTASTQASSRPEGLEPQQVECMRNTSPDVAGTEGPEALHCTAEHLGNRTTSLLEAQTPCHHCQCTPVSPAASSEVLGPKASGSAAQQAAPTKSTAGMRDHPASRCALCRQQSSPPTAHLCKQHAYIMGPIKMSVLAPPSSQGLLCLCGMPPMAYPPPHPPSIPTQASSCICRAAVCKQTSKPPVRTKNQPMHVRTGSLNVMSPLLTPSAFAANTTSWPADQCTPHT